MTQIITTQNSYYPGAFVVQLVNVIIGIIEAAFAIRIVLELFGANPTAPFIAWVYGATGSMLGPFAGAFPNISLGGGMVLDVVALLGMIVYAVLGWVLLQLLSFIFSTAVRNI